MHLSLNELTNAVKALHTANELLKQSLGREPQNVELHKALRDACIQRFEFCVELSWKTAVRFLGLETKAPNPAVRDMAQNKIIDDPQVWFDFLIARNKTSHTYNENLAKEIYLVVQSSVSEFEKLIERLKKIK